MPGHLPGGVTGTGIAQGHHQQGGKPGGRGMGKGVVQGHPGVLPRGTGQAGKAGAHLARGHRFCQGQALSIPARQIFIFQPCLFQAAQKPLTVLHQPFSGFPIAKGRKTGIGHAQEKAQRHAFRRFIMPGMPEGVGRLGQAVGAEFHAVKEGKALLQKGRGIRPF